MTDIICLDKMTPMERVGSGDDLQNKKLAYATLASCSALVCGAAMVATSPSIIIGGISGIGMAKAFIQLPSILKFALSGSIGLYAWQFKEVPKKVPFTLEIKPHTWKVPIGKNRTGQWVYIDFDRIPHFKCGGCTGSGKTYAMQCILAMLSQMHTPDYLEFQIIDMKEGASFAAFQNLPHTKGVYSDAFSALEALEEVHAIMKERLREIQKARRNFQPLPKFKRIIVAIDEGGELAPAFIEDPEEKKARKKCMDLLSSLARVGREPRISVFYTTQRPSNDTLPVGIRGQLEGTLCFRMENELDSEILLRRKGAETLKKIPGRMIYKTPDGEQEVQFLNIKEDTMKAWLTAWGYGYEVTADTNDTSKDIEYTEGVQSDTLSIPEFTDKWEPE